MSHKWGVRMPCTMQIDAFHSVRHLFLMSARFSVFLLFIGTGFAWAEPEKLTTQEYFGNNVRPLLQQYCFPCHSSEKHKGDFDMESFTSISDIKRHPKVWQDAAEKLANNDMPPEEKPQPSLAEKERISNWLLAILNEIARERAGDPGPVVLRRLSNAEYTYTVQDLTGIESLQPAREFPIDGASGEGFMNTGQALVMSPSLITKYLDAGKEIASHAVLLPDGIRFSPKSTRRDWADEILAQIRQFYLQFSDPHGGDKVNLQGIVFETNEGGRLPIEKYLAATLTKYDHKDDLRKTLDTLARERGLNSKYLKNLSIMLSGKEPSLLLDALRARWRKSKLEDAGELAAEISKWQKALWKFNTVGHIGKLGGPKSWMEPVNPLLAKQEIRLKLPASADTKEVMLYLVASDAGDGNENDVVIWERPRLVAPGRSDLLLRDVRQVSLELAHRREQVFAGTARCLVAAGEASGNQNKPDITALALKYDVDAESLAAWFDYLGIGADDTRIDSYLTNKLTKLSNYDFINGWGSNETPLIVANASDQHVRIPGNMVPHSVAVHPSPKLQAVVSWRSPLAATMRIDALVTHAHPECGNGITWSLEVRRGGTRQRLASGATQGGKEIKVGPFENIAVQQGDLVSLLIGPRDGNHACDLTAVDLILSSPGENARTWKLSTDVSPDILAGNPHADRFGNDGVWHFYTEPDNGGSEIGPVIPSGSILAQWQSSPNRQEKMALAEKLQKLLTSGPPAAKETPDGKLYQELASLSGPLFNRIRNGSRVLETKAASTPVNSAGDKWGLAPESFGQRPNEPGGAAIANASSLIDPASLCVQAPAIIEVRLPADLVAGCEFVTTGALDSQMGKEGSVQLQVLTNRPDSQSGLLASAVTQTQATGPWTSDNRRISHTTPIVVNDGSNARKRFELAFDDFRNWFPTALCYTKIVPVDEAVTLTLMYREDDHLTRLMLDDAQKAKLDRLWDELHYVSHDAIMLVDAFEQLWQYATQDADPKVFEPLRKPIHERAAAFRQRLIDTEPNHIQAVLDFANRAYRRPMLDVEKEELRGLYRKLREQEVPHEQAVRLLLARVLVAPAFLYRAENPGPGLAQVPINDWELANRLSYFLWSSMPDSELASAAAGGKLHDAEVLAAQTQRMLGSPKVRRLATEFACQWLHIRDFDNLDEKSERHFPTFGGLRSAMYEESILFFTDLFQHNGSVLDILDADYAFLNESLAKHYDIPGVSGGEWQRVDGVKKFYRGGILGQATTLAKQSGASRTSPILRGNWVAEVLLGDKLPRPPKDVPKLPEDEATETLTVRQLTEKHSTDPRCYVCHARMDAFGFALESFDAIGRHRERDLGDRPINTRAKLRDGTEIDGIDGLRKYLVTARRDAFLRQFCRKLLGYALGRAVQLSDEPLLGEMQTEMKANDFRTGVAIQCIVQSRQFREIRGKEMAYDQ